MTGGSGHLGASMVRFLRGAGGVVVAVARGLMGSPHWLTRALPPLPHPDAAQDGGLKSQPHRAPGDVSIKQALPHRAHRLGLDSQRNIVDFRSLAA